MKKNSLWAIALVLIGCITFFLFSCENKEDFFPESRQEPLMIVEGRSHAGITVVKDQQYGNYLSMKTTKTMENVNMYLDRLERDEFSTTGDTELDKWEKGLSDFTSLRMQEKQNNIPFEKRYVNRAISTLLNKNGYIMIDNILYHDNGNEVNIIKSDGSKKLYFTKNKGFVDQTSAKSAMECNGFGDMPSSAENLWCGNFGYTFRLKGVMNHYHTWVPLANDKLYATITHGEFDCLGNRAYPYSNLSITSSYTGTRNGVNISASSINTNINTTSTSYQIVVVEGRNLCFSSVNINYKVKTLAPGGNVLSNSSLNTYTTY